MELPNEIKISQKNATQKGASKQLVLLREIPGHSSVPLEECVSPPRAPVKVMEKGKFITLFNDRIEATISKKNGQVVSLKLEREEMLASPIKIRIHYDYPCGIRKIEAGMFDSWEVYIYDGLNRFFYKDLKKPREVKIVENGPLRATVRVVYEYKQLLRPKSKFVLEYILDADSSILGINLNIEWHAWHRMARLLIPVKHRGKNAIFEAPYGISIRKDAGAVDALPYERAKYEVPGQRWAATEDGKCGVAIINSARYGYSYIAGTLGLSLLRSATYPSQKTHMPNPDAIKVAYQFNIQEHAEHFPNLGKIIASLLFLIPTELRVFEPMDQGKNSILVGVYPYKGSWQDAMVPHIAGAFLYKPRLVRDQLRVTRLPQINGDAMITAVKLHEERGDVVLRLFNPYNREVSVELQNTADFRVFESDGLEQKRAPVERRIVLPPLAVKTLILVPEQKNPSQE